MFIPIWVVVFSISGAFLVGSRLGRRWERNRTEKWLDAACETVRASDLRFQAIWAEEKRVREVALKLGVESQIDEIMARPIGKEG